MLTSIKLRRLALLLFTAGVGTGIAQVPNGGFESGSDSSIDNWIIQAGSASAAIAATFLSSMDDTTLTAYDGSRFALLQYQNGEPAIIATTFKHQLRSSDIQARIVYVPNSSLQRFSVSVTYLHYPAADSVDTVMHRVFHINPYHGQMVRNYDWAHITLSFDETDFNSGQLPDSCVITIHMDAGQARHASTLLMIDDLKFGTEVLAIHRPPVHMPLSPFPNPAPKGQFFVEGLQQGDFIDIHTLQGKLIESTEVLGALKTYLPYRQPLTTGAYMVSVRRENGTPRQALLLVP